MGTHSLFWVNARQGGRGRPAGGLLLGIDNKFCSRFVVHKYNDFFVLTCKICDIKLALFFVYIAGDKWDQIVKEIGATADYFEELGFAPLMLGDMNARVGREDNLIDLSPLPVSNMTGNILNSKMSQDTVCNNRGKTLLDLCTDHNMLILNGRTRDDCDGNFTFISPIGNSVNDYCLFPLNHSIIFSQFKIHSLPDSDHLPLQLDMFTDLPNNPSHLDNWRRFHWNYKNAGKYTTHINAQANFCTINFDDTNETSTNIKSIITNAAISSGMLANKVTNNNKKISKLWYDDDCKLAYKLMKNSLIDFRHAKNDDGLLQSYYQFKRKYKNLLKEKSKKFYTTEILQFSTIKNTKDFWTVVRRYRGINSGVSTSIIPQDWINHFQTLLNPIVSCLIPTYIFPTQTNDILDSDFTSSEICLTLQSLQKGKAPGFDGLPYDFYKAVPGVLIEKITLHFNKILHSGTIPDCFKLALYCPLFKKGDFNNPKNYRGISFLDCYGKIFMSAILNRLTKWERINDIFVENQAGFRANYSTIEHIFTLTSLINTHIAKRKGRFYIFFIDFSSAFDTINRNLLLFKLAKLGISTKIITLIKNYYTNTQLQVITPDGLTDPFDANCGVRQGCMLSPFLFSCFLNDFNTIFDHGGCKLDGEKLYYLAFADDIATISDNLVGFNRMIREVEKYVKNNGLTVNLDKSMIMVCRKGGRLKDSECFSFNNTPIKITNNYKYLGVTITTAGKFYLHWKDRLTLAKFSTNSLYTLINKNTNSIQPKLKLFDAIGRAIIGYGAQVWGGFRSKEVETAQLYFLKKLLRLPFWTPTYIILLETGRHSLFITTLKLHLNFILKCLLFPHTKIVYKILQNLISTNTFFINNIHKLALIANVIINQSDWGNNQQLQIKFNQMHAYYISTEKETFLNKALDSSTRIIYKNIKLDNNCELYLLQLPIWKARILIKVRSETFFLNFNAGKDNYDDFNLSYLCTMCNMKMIENLNHLLFECPRYQGYRNKYFGTNAFNLDTVISGLRGNNIIFWDKIIYLMEDIINMRKIWMEEMED